MAVTTAEETARELIGGWVARYGVPRSVTSDQGPQFVSALWRAVCRRMGTEHRLAPAYHPATNGLVERWHRDLKRALATRMAGTADWTARLPWALLQLRTAIRDDTGVSPAHVVYGVDLRVPGALVEDSPPEGPEMLDPAVEAVFAGAKAPFAAAEYGRPAATRAADYSTGWAYIRKPAKPGLAPVYQGPFRVLHQSDTTVTVERDGAELYYPREWARPAPAPAPDDPRPRGRGRPPRRLRTSLNEFGRPIFVRTGNLIATPGLSSRATTPTRPTGGNPPVEAKTDGSASGKPAAAGRTPVGHAQERPQPVVTRLGREVKTPWRFRDDLME